MKKITAGYNTVSPDLYTLLKEYIKENRHSPTEAETVLWEHLRGKSTGYKFRRQHAIGDFIADFVCLSERLIIEVDGEYHNDPQQVEYDQIRTRALNAMGYDVLRFSNEEILGSPEDVIEAIINYIEQ